MIQDGQARPQLLQTRLLHGQLPLRAIAELQLASWLAGAQFPALFGRVAGELDLLFQSGDGPGEIRPLAQLIASGSCIGVVAGLGDRARPARGGHLGDHPLALRPDLLVVVQSGPAALGQIRAGEPPQMGSQRHNHGSVPGRDPQSGADPQRGDQRRLHRRPDRVADPPAHELVRDAGWPSTCGPTSCLAQLRAFRARFRADRFP